MSSKDPRSQDQRTTWRYASMGIELAAAVIGLTLAGYWVDYHFQTAPRGVLVGAVLGIVGGLYNFLREAIKLSRETDRSRHETAQRKHGDERDDE